MYPFYSAVSRIVVGLRVNEQLLLRHLPKGSKGKPRNIGYDSWCAGRGSNQTPLFRIIATPTCSAKSKYNVLARLEASAAILLNDFVFCVTRQRRLV